MGCHGVERLQQQHVLALMGGRQACLKEDSVLLLGIRDPVMPKNGGGDSAQALQARQATLNEGPDLSDAFAVHLWRERKGPLYVGGISPKKGTFTN